MFKLLRKYDKWILAVGGSLLMVVFLLPQALQQFGANPRKSAIANTDDGTIIEQTGFLDAASLRAKVDNLVAVDPGA